MKTAYTILFAISFFSLSATNTVSVNLKIKNILDAAVSNAELEIYTMNSSETLTIESSKEGCATIRLERNRKYLLEVSHPDYLIEKLAFNLDSVKLDVVEFKIEMEVKYEIGHNLQWIDLDSMYIKLVGDSLPESFVSVSNKELLGNQEIWVLISDDKRSTRYFMWKNRIDGNPYIVDGERLELKVSLSKEERDVVLVEYLGILKKYYVTRKRSILGDRYEFEIKGEKKTDNNEFRK